MLSHPEDKLHECKNCGNQFKGFICNQCGQKVKHFSSSPKGLFLEWWFVRKEDFQRFIFTTKEMLLRPATVLNEYLDGKRRKYYNSTNYFLLIASIAAFITIQFRQADGAQTMQNINEMYASMGIPIDPDNPGGAYAFEWMNRHYNIALMLTLPFLVLSTFLINKWVFKAKRYTFGEHFVMNLFVYGLNVFIMLPTQPFLNDQSLSGALFLFNMVFLALLYAWVQKDLYSLSWLKAILAGLLFCIFYALIFVLFFVLIAILTVIVIVSVMTVVKMFR